MKPFLWDKHFLTGLAEVDDQHKGLINLINEFGELISGGDNIPKEGVNDIIGRLADYTNYHFTTEESMMLDKGIDRRHFSQHCEEHQRFINDVKLMYSHLSYDNPQSSESLLEFLIYWLAYHILGVDQFMAQQLEHIENGMSPSEAYFTVEQEKDQETKTEPLLVALNGLFKQVSDRNRELSLLNTTLEQRVEERTKELVAANLNLEQMAMTDQLTKLPNRRHAMQSLSNTWELSNENSSPLSLIMIDADGFKEINDTYGHDAGDEVLKALSTQLVNAFRTDDIVCRMGGDEFMVICVDTPIDGAMHVAEIARKSVADMKVKAGDGTWDGSISLGVATRTEKTKKKEDLIKAADQAVYKAKHGGRNKVASIND